MLLKKFKTKCKRCGKEVLIDDMVHDKKTKNGICRSCYEHRPKEETKTPVLKNNKTNYKCSNCNYKFSRDMSKHKRECPYCKSEKIIEVR